MSQDRTKHKILPPSRFGLIQITRQRVRPEMNIKTKEPNPNQNGEVEAFYNFDYQNVVAKLGYQVSLSEYLHIGSSLNYFFQRIDTVNGFGVNVDVGLVSSFDNLSLSLVLKNYYLITEIESEKYPLQIKRWEMRELSIEDNRISAQLYLANTSVSYTHLTLPTKA